MTIFDILAGHYDAGNNTFFYLNQRIKLERYSISRHITQNLSIDKIKRIYKEPYILD